ncbi:porin [Bowmanella dokdonensis]|uniref:Porin n=1 Tax=Bowmanella dokdonensis TaxID=751969 RepID=A0A939ISD3_9ALTE|nr:porin [Bowmanella dokdonensis]
MKFFLPHSVCALFSVSLLAVSAEAVAEPVTLYGKGNVSFQSADEGEGRFTELKSNNSRLGVKGDFSLENGLTAFYLFEWQIDLADLSGSDNFKSRNQYIGLKGDFGAVLLGRNDTMLKQSQGKIDQFNDLEADIKALWQGENRVSNSLTYQSPRYRGFQLGVTYIAEEAPESEPGYSVSLSHGDSKLKKQPWFASLAVDRDVAGFDIQRFSLQYKLDDWIFGGIVQRQEASDTGLERDGWLASLAYDLSDFRLKAQYQELEEDSSASVGADYPLSDNIKLYAFYTRQEKQSSSDKSWLAAGMELTF